METMRWEGGALLLLDQTKLPHEVEYIACHDYDQVAQAIVTMVVRGAPAIGAAAAYGVALAALAYAGDDREGLINRVREGSAVLEKTRPTAVNLFWALRRMMSRLEDLASSSGAAIKEGLVAEAQAILQEDIQRNRMMGQFGNELVPQGARILTHCNAGALATGGYGTALGVIRAAHEAGKNIAVYADETRPLLQGARLTAWELMADGIPVTLIADNMAGYCMAKGMIDMVVVGADRITANGDVANKIGTYTVAILAREHGIPFYVAAPLSTIDLSLSNGQEIPIEERGHDEMRQVFGQPTAPKGVAVFNPAFDVTPNPLVTAIITDGGIARPPYRESLRRLCKGE